MSMNLLRKIDMQEATRLTREGRLREAMALLRGAPSGGSGPGPASGTDGHDHVPNATVLEMRPPATAGGVWTPPPMEAGGAPAHAGRKPYPKAWESHSRPAFGMGLTPAEANRKTVPVNGARFEEHTYANRVGTRKYKLYVPSGFVGQPLPLVVMLHGCTQSPDDFAAGTGMNAVAEEELFLVAYPAQPQSANASKCWNWFNAGDQQRDQGEPALIAGITLQIMNDFSVDERRVYIAGLSAGGAAAAIMGATYPELYAAIGVHSGLACGAANDMPSAFSAMRQGGSAKRTEPRHTGGPIPTIVFHGDRDMTVSAINGDQVVAQSKAGAQLRADVSHGKADGGMAYTRTIHRDGDNKPILEQWLLHGAGHAWSGGSSDGSYTEPRGPDASREMARFFAHHRSTPAPVRA
jgi:poly(hydroxyalkanoate) depolymerase family esterase